jgi:hypothetical protein
MPFTVRIAHAVVESERSAGVEPKYRCVPVDAVRIGAIIDDRVFVPPVHVLVDDKDRVEHEPMRDTGAEKDHRVPHQSGELCRPSPLSGLCSFAFGNVSILPADRIAESRSEDEWIGVLSAIRSERRSVDEGEVQITRRRSERSCCLRCVGVPI